MTEKPQQSEELNKIDNSKQSNKSKKKKIIISSIIFATIVISIVVAFFIFKPKENYDANVSFLNVDETEADSLLEIMTIEQKVAQILIINSDSISLDIDTNVCGVFISADSLEDYNQTYKKLLDQTGVKSFICQSSDISIPKIFSYYYENIISTQALFSIRDTVLIQEYFDFVVLQDSIFGVNFNFISFIEYVADSVNYDTVQIRFYQNFTSQFLERFISKNVLVTIPYIDFPQSDTILTDLWKEFYETQIENGLPSLYLSDNKDIDKLINEYKFGGVIVGNNDFDDYSLFLESDFDILYIDQNYEETFENIVKIAKKKKKFEKLLDNKVKKILLAKTWLKQNENSVRKFNISLNKIENKTNEVFFRKLTKYSSILLNNNKNLLPFIDLNKKYECYVLGRLNTEEFINVINKYTNVNCHLITGNPAEVLEKTNIASTSNLIFVINNIKIDTVFVSLLKKIDNQQNIAVVNFNEIENLQLLENINHLIHIWNNNNISQSYVAQLLFGGIEANAELPFFVSDLLYFNKGVVSPKTRLGYDIPEMVGIDSEKLLEIDSIANDAISKYVFPGCQVFIAKDGVILVDKSYGFHTYSKSQKVVHDNVYDIASVTKIAATTISAMKMYEQGKLPLDNSIGSYFNDTNIEYDRIKPDTLIRIDTIYKYEDVNWRKKIKGLDTVQIGDSIIVSFDTVIYKLTPVNNIFKVTPRQLLMHQSGIQPAMPILKLMLLNNDYFRRIKDLYSDGLDSLVNDYSYQEKKNLIYANRYIKDSAEVQVAAGMYLNKAYEDTLWRDTKQLAVWSKKVYVYSDVNMIILQITIDSINNKGINVYTWQNFYKPLGLEYISYLPKNNYPILNIIPTERDTYWRRQLIWGYVHDPSAAVLGGIAGNAGLFSNAYSLGVLAQMLINKGTYGGQRFLGSGTISKFTATQPDSYRGLGFDKWSKRQIIARDASPNTFGHTGFTGACFWADPDNNIAYVFLSNRVHPSANNWKISKYRVRQKIHQVVYDARID